MDVKINRLDPNVPDPVESRRRAAGRLVRFVYSIIVFGVLGFFVVYFGAPFVFLSGPGTVTSRRYVISLPYTVQVSQMNLVPGATVKAGEEIAQVLSPEQDSIVATYMRALADIAGRMAELRIKARVAQEFLEAVRSYLSVTEEAVKRVDTMSAATVTFRMEVLRERAGIVSTGLADVGQSLTAGTPITEILDPTDIFVDWYIPNERLIDPKVGNEVFVLFGNRRIPGKIAQILPVSGVFAGTQQLLARDRPATQIARIRFDPDVSPPPLNTTVDVRMHYTAISAHVATWLVPLFGPH